MRKLLLVLAILLATASPGYAQDDGLRETGRACAFGGAVLGVTSLLVLYPALATASTTLPAVSLIFGNTLFGCGIAAIGAAAAYGFSILYDGMAGPETPETPPGATRTSLIAH